MFDEFITEKNTEVVEIFGLFNEFQIQTEI